MVNIICDSCRKSIPDAQREVNYFVYSDKDICASCFSKMEDTLNQKMAKESKFTYKMYYKKQKEIISSMCR